VIVAHRLETLASVDEIAVLEAGAVVEHGRREVLAADPTSRFGRLLRTASSSFLADEAAS
jgi:ATP-binding cassette, subfamily B, bacterial